jgi:2-polyprenyl-3-methyl-5-hydroxy-6-metoxy-1,4-benzoquinol methylase
MSKISSEVDDRHLIRVETQFNRFDKQWQELYDKPWRVNDLVIKNRKDFSLDFLYRHVKPGASILDAGCGAGVVTLELAKNGFLVHGTDIAPKMIKRAQRLFFENDIDPSRYGFSVGEITESNLAENSFDGIIALGFLEYQPDEPKVLAFLHKLLRPGGLLVITIPINIRISGLLGLGKIYGAAKRRIKTLVARGEDWRKPAAGLSINAHSFSGFKKLVQRAGFTLIDYKRHGYANFWPLQSVEASKQYKIELFLHNHLTQIAKFLPIDRFANELIVVAKK